MTISVTQTGSDRKSAERAVGHLRRIGGKLRTGLRILLVEHLAIGDPRRTVVELDGTGRQNLDVFEDQVANLRFSKRRMHGVARGIIADASDRDNAGQAA